MEVGDWDRFTGGAIGAYLGLVPTEHSSGGSRSQGSITKIGNTHARRLLVEAAWYRKTYHSPGVMMLSRWAAAPPAARTRSREGNHRQHQGWENYLARKKLSPANAVVDESAWGAVSELLPIRFPRPLPEPGVRISTHRALHGRFVRRRSWPSRG